MPQIIPIRDLKNTSEISLLCHNSEEPVFITKNGYGDMVIMSMDVYEKSMFLQDLNHKLKLAQTQIDNGEVEDAKAALARLRSKYGL
jgi:PHD/YefM family antitoxin component YafN of YafNO toxin-antitoxin module